MARSLSGTGRVIIFRLLHDWQTGAECIMAYTAGEASAAVIGVIPIEGNEAEPGDLFALAGRHNADKMTEYRGTAEQNRASWLACLGTGAMRVPKPDTLDLRSAAWSLDMVQTHDMEQARYGHLSVTSGRMHLEDPAQLQQAHALFKGATV